ncbi:hypothetical protein NQZ68_012240 [Dissostichus eleginoides]|nr:hypothetical protein NQZ68_012240 [Dissostichus eleginoides]
MDNCKEKKEGRRWERKDAIEPYCIMVAAVGVQMVRIFTRQHSDAHHPKITGS